MAKKKKVAKYIMGLLTDDFQALSELSKTMAKMTKTVENLPEDIAYTLDQIDALEEARHESLKLARECEAAIKTFEGTI